MTEPNLFKYENGHTWIGTEWRLYQNKSHWGKGLVHPLKHKRTIWRLQRNRYEETTDK
jgi:hypothetical protein